MPQDVPDAPTAYRDIVIRELATLEEYQACVELQEETWGRGFSERVPAAILRVSQRIGGVTAGAFDDAGRLVGFVFGMTGVRDGTLVHWSDMLAVREEMRGGNIGERLKEYQRQRTITLGVRTMFWTFDPLVARNAHFNINKLGARPVEYVVDMYGSQTGSTLHGAVPTDRLVIAWDLADPRPMSRHAERTQEGDALLPLANPVDSRPLPVGAQTVKVQVPRSPSDLPDEATRLKWRLNVRAAMIPLFDAGYVVQRFVRSTADGALPYYVLARP